MVEMASSGKLSYKELASVKVSKSKELVVSSCSAGGFTIASRMSVVNDDGTPGFIFLKGATRVQTLKQLEAVRDMLDAAVKRATEDGLGEVDWD